MSVSEQPPTSEGREEKAPCPNCGRTNYRVIGEARLEGAVAYTAENPFGVVMQTRCDWCWPLRMDAYYYGFGATGVESVDRVLSAVASAGKGYHHTESWNESDIDDWGPFHGGSYAEWIQNAANEAADELTTLRASLTEAQAEIERLKADAEAFHMDYRMKCDVETKALHADQPAAMQSAVQKIAERFKANVKGSL